ncbi:MAG TPA: TIGR01777 family oxidoreductase [Gemmatimonadales bacterium]|nr:TIGR01777 family oxidoreductase [Gemmatimonadales bacterium]
MHVFLTGATGFIGTALVRALVARGDGCTVVSRSGRDPWSNPRVRMVRADPGMPGPWQVDVAGADVVVNLAGERIVNPPLRWTAERKARLRRSRVQVTCQVVAAIRAASRRPRLLVSGSAVGYYGSRQSDVLDESAGPGSGFLADLAREWEGAALAGRDATSVAVVRTGMVLGPAGGVLASLLTPFRLGLGGPWGAGDQWWPWIHQDDAVGLLLHIMDHGLSGPVNLVGPNPVTVIQFARSLAGVLGRPAIIPAPEWALRLAMGESADALLASLRVVPARALAEGFAFQFPALEPALVALLKPAT